MVYSLEILMYLTTSPKEPISNLNLKVCSSSGCYILILGVFLGSLGIGARLNGMKLGWMVGIGFIELLSVIFVSC